jgi:hypothetical protein
MSETLKDPAAAMPSDQPSSEPAALQVTDSAGLKTTVFVDAGNATVLLTKAHDHENDGADGPDAAETGGSGD